MAEAAGAVGLLSSTIQLVYFAIKLIKSLDGLVSTTDDAPVPFRSIRLQLPLVINVLQRTQQKASSGHINDELALALKSIIDSCVNQAETLTAILRRIVPIANTLIASKRLQALRTMSYDREVQKSIERLQNNIRMLILHQARNNSDIVMPKPPQPTLSPPTQSPKFSFGLNLGSAPQIAQGAFVGREAELNQLLAWLTPKSPLQNMVALCGPGGMGKTQLSIAFATLHQDKYSSVFWLNAKDEVTLKQDFVNLSKVIFDENQHLRVGSIIDEDQAVQEVRQWLSHQENDQWLILFDNYDDPKLPGINNSTGYDIRRFFPSRSQGSILITTSSHQLTFAKQLRLQNLDNLDQSLAILSSRSGRDLKDELDAAEIALRLDNMPLALATAGMYLSQTTQSLRDYLIAHEGTAEELIDYKDQIIFSTYDLSVTQIQNQDPEAAELLRLLAYFGDEGIDYDLMRAAEECGLLWLSTLTKEKMRFNQAMTRLHDYSFVEVSKGSYCLHTCVHDWTLQKLNREISPQYYWVAMHCIATNVKMESERDFWETNQRLIRHAFRLEHSRFKHLLDRAELDESRSDDLYSLGVLWDLHGQSLRAIEMYHRALVGYEKLLGAEHISTLTTMHNLGNLYMSQGKMLEAEQIYQTVLAGKERALGLDHTSTLSTVYNLGVLYRNQDRIAEAECIYLRATAGYEKTLGPDHLSTLNAVLSLGDLYREQGKAIEMEQMYQRALISHNKIFGSGYTSTLITANNLMIPYRNQGKMVETEQMYQQALRGRETVLEPDHTSTFDTVNNLDSLYKNHRKVVVAEHVHRRTTEGYPKTPGSDHNGIQANQGAHFGSRGAHSGTSVTQPWSAFLRNTSGKNAAIDTLNHANSDSDETARPVLFSDSTASMALLGSYQSSSPERVALIELTNLLAKEEILKALFFAASERSLLDSRSFSSELFRLLEKFARDLSAEAGSTITSAERDSYTFISQNAQELSITISNVYFKSQDWSEKMKQLDYLHNESKEAGQEGLLRDYLSSRNKAESPVQSIESLNEPQSFSDYETWRTAVNVTDEEVSLSEREEHHSIDSADGLSEYELNDTLAQDQTRLSVTRSQAYKWLVKDLYYFVTERMFDWTRLEAQWKAESKHLIPVELRSATPDQIQFIPKESPGIMDRVKLAFEYFSGEKWIWWPLQSPKPELETGKIRLRWSCACGESRWADVSTDLAQKVDRFIHLDVGQRKDVIFPDLVTVWGEYANATALLQPFESSSGDFLGDIGLQTLGNQSKSRHLIWPEQEPSSSTLKPPNKPSPSSPSVQPKFILLCVDRGGRLYHSQIEIFDHMNDDQFFEAFRRHYRNLRGWWRYWLHPRQFAFCHCSKFTRYDVNKLHYQHNGLPLESSYSYIPKPPDQPYVCPIPPSMWKDRFYDHVCARGLRNAVLRIPKRHGRFELDTHMSFEDMWGLNVEFSPHLVRIVLWQMFFCAAGWAFFIYWLDKHNNDWQTAGVPISIILGAMVAFWTPLSGKFRQSLTVRQD